MSNSGTIDIWQIANCFLADRKSTINETSFNYLKGALRARDVLKIVNFSVNPLMLRLQEYRTLSQFVAFFSKNATFTDDARCTVAAEKRFIEAEVLCRLTNKRLRYYASHPERDVFLPEMVKMKKELSILLGSPVTMLNGIPDNIRLTSGSTEDTSRAQSLPYLKIRKVVSCTPGAIPFVSALARHYGVEPRIRTVEANRLCLVPKNAKTHRTIAAEPQGNLPFQLGIDTYLKARLGRWGIDLHSQLRNQELAHLGSITGEYATIDLSMASDTLSRALVELLLPKKWVEILTRLRSPCYKGPFGVGEYQKFSSMGNGYTFSLETAIFAAAIRSCGITDYAVYGDDIIVPTAKAGEVIKLLRHIGFRTNSDKTFTEGPFRESCGADYYRGTAVRPFYIRKHSSLLKTDVAHIVNGLYRVGDVGGELWKLALGISQAWSLPYTPCGVNTSNGVHITWNECRTNGLVQSTGWIYHCKQLVAASDAPKVRALHGLKALLYSSYFKNQQSGWTVRFTPSATKIVRFTEAPEKTKGLILTQKVRTRRLPVWEQQPTPATAHIDILTSWLKLQFA